MEYVRRGSQNNIVKQRINRQHNLIGTIKDRHQTWKTEIDVFKFKEEHMIVDMSLDTTYICWPNTGKECYKNFEILRTLRKSNTFPQVPFKRRTCFHGENSQVFVQIPAQRSRHG